MSQIPENLPPPFISADIPKGKSARCNTTHKNIQAALKVRMPEGNYFGAKSEEGSDEKGSVPTKNWPPLEDEKDDKELIANQGLWLLGFKVMLRSALPCKKNMKKAGNIETEIWHMTKHKGAT